ncbi:MAG: C4-dicarboxylate TRAP transporter substrate-binding protein [Alphaproteobacteria bacterium]|nr:C4-dicarboxylate TRAP transporter substrate-binding protein [Alphaproteobacteria bacterium]
MRKFALPLALAGALLAASAAPTLAETEIKGATYLAPTHPLGHGYEVFKKVVEKESGGKIKVRVFQGGSLLPAKAISDGVRDGVADVGTVTMTYTPSYYPRGLLLGDLAMYGPNDTAAAIAQSELFILHCPGCQADARKQNQLVFAGFSTPQYVLIGKGPMNTLETIKGKKLRAGGPLWARFAESVGAIAVNVPSSEIYEGLSRGIIDAAMYARGGLKTHGLADVADTVSEVPLGSFRAQNYFSYNIDSWKSLTPAERTIVLKGIAAGAIANRMAYDEGEEEGVALGKEKGIKFLQPDAAMMKAVDAFVERDTEETIQRWKEKGVTEAAEIVATYKELYKKYEPMVTPIQNDEQKLTELLWNEVLSKIDVNTFGME